MIHLNLKARPPWRPRDWNLSEGSTISAFLYSLPPAIQRLNRDAGIHRDLVAANPERP
jgi:hypothetical protein